MVMETIISVYNYHSFLATWWSTQIRIKFNFFPKPTKAEKIEEVARQVVAKHNFRRLMAKNAGRTYWTSSTYSMKQKFKDFPQKMNFVIFLTKFKTLIFYLDNSKNFWENLLSFWSSKNIEANAEIFGISCIFIL